MPASATITSFYSFSAGQVIKSAEINTNFSTFRGHIIPVDPNTLASAATLTYDLGASDRYWRTAYIGGLNANTIAATSIDATTLTVSSLINLTGGRIRFPATQLADGNANTLDDYEEGEAQVTFTTGGGSITINTSFDTIAYTKIGRQVNITGQLLVTSVSAPTGNLAIAGLPFACATLTELAERGACSVRGDGLGTGATGALQGYISQGDTTLNIERFLNGNATATASLMTSTASLIINLTYFTA